MSTIIIKCLFFVVWIVHILCQDRPKITTLNGHLILEAAKDKNIYIRVSGPKSAIFVQDINLLHLGVTNNIVQYETDNTFQKYLIGRKGLLTRIEILENQTRTTPYGIVNNITLLMRRVNRLSNRLSMIQSQISRLKDECESAPCQNGGTCLNLGNRYYCMCPNNWEGLNCDVDVNECRNFAGTDLGCQNGATCINRPGSYECLCLSGWFGIHCTRRAKDCSAGNFEMCGYGTCIPVTHGDGIKCICNQGWETNGTGVACLTDVNECDSSRGPRCSINPKVDCINLPGTFRCGQCPSGYEGDGFTCHDINECLSIPNGGCSPLVTCHNTIGSRICGPCPPDYLGDGSTCTWRGSCNINHGGCHPSAQCTESMGVVQCLCPPEMDGDGRGMYGCYVSLYGNSTKRCETNPCGVNGRCHPLVTGYTCLCREGYSGVHCDVPTDYCSSNPCQNGGTCRRDETSIGFRCECTAAYSGHFCQLRAKSCSGVLDAEEGTLIYPLHNNSYDHDVKCAWVIHTAPNKVINVTFSKFDIELEPECMYDFLQIHDGRTSSNQLIGRFCGNEPPKGGNIVSSHNNLYLWFRSDKSVAKGGFALHWNSIDPVCGGEINASRHGNINSPGSPGKYPPNRDCFWHLTTVFGKRIQLHFYALDIEKHTNCSFDYLSIYDGEHTTDPLISKYCNTTQPPPIQSASSEMLIHFHSDAYGSGNGFQISYAPIAGIPGCGGEYNIDKGDIVSPSFNGVYLNNLLCEYRINTEPDTTIRLDFKLFKLEKSDWCRLDFLKIYDGPTSDSKLVGKFCGDTYPKSYTSSTNKIFLIFKTDYSSASDGFRITFETVCQKIISGESGVLSSPGYPNHYPPNKVCEYIIETTPGNAIQLTFIDFDIEDNIYFHCQYDNIEIRDGADRNATLLGKYCGGVQHIPPTQTSTLNYLYLRFHSDMSISGTGFYANYTSIKTECGGVYRETTGLITHPSGDGQNLLYKNGQKCTWILIAPPGKFIKLNWIRFHVDIMLLPCNRDYVELIEIDDNNQYETLGKFCGTLSPPALTTTTNRLMIKFNSDDSVQSYGFSLSYTFLDQTLHCGAVFVKSHGFIYSPGWPKPYEPNRDCIWTITVPVGQQIKLHISKFDLEVPLAGRCDLGDYLEIHNGLTENSPLVGKYCASFRSRNITSMSNKIYLRFHSDAYIAGYGFKIEWDGTITGCGGVLTSPSGSISSPNYPENYYANAECIYKIVVSQGSRIRLHFTDLNLEITNGCKNDYVEVFDGRDEDSVSLGKYCLMRNSIHLQTTGNIAFIKFLSNAHVVSKGFILNYETTCGTILTGKHGLIESPGYPDSYQLYMNCLWTINAPKGNKIKVTFNHFDIYMNHPRTGFSFYSGGWSLPGLSDAKCENDYLQWKETSKSKFSDHYCGTSPPHINGIEGNSLQIKFVSGSFMPQTGFQLEWVSYGCGGYLKDRTGNISLNKEIVSTGPLECEWVIESPVGTSITINFDSVYMSDTPNCASDAIEVFNGQSIRSPILTKFCHQSNITHVRSTTNYMLIRFTKSSNLRDISFSSNFNSWNTGCGGRIISNSGTVHSNNYPRNYDNNHNCVWTIIVPKNHRIELNFLDLDLYSISDYDCNDCIKIYQAEYISNLNFTDIICSYSKTKQILSRSNVLSLQFVTDSSGTAKGFKANFTVTCGAVINGTHDGVISSEKFVGRSNVSCFWTILAPSLDQKVTLTITYLAIPNDIHIRTNRSCPSTFLRIRDGNEYSSPIVGEYCGRRVPPSIISHGSALTIELGTYSDLIIGEFSAHYTTFLNACGGTLTSEEGIIVSPNFPQPYPINTDCEWTLATSAGNKVYILFETFNLQYSEDCNQDYLEVRENDSRGLLIDVYCGNEIPTNTTFSSKLYLKFHSDSIESSTGFMIRYGFLHGNDIRGLDSGDVASPLYPLKYKGAADYSWRITTSSGTITLNIIKLEILRHSETCSNYISIYDGYDDDASLIENICGFLIDENKMIVTSSNVVYIKLKLDTTNTGAMFLLHWSKTEGNDIISEKGVNCGSNKTEIIEPGHFLNIKSPNFPKHYDTNLNCHWVFKTLPGYHLILRFTTFKLEETTNCYADSISIFKSEVLNEWSPITEKTCLSEGIIKTFNASTYLKIVFVSDGSVTAKGFEAQITSVCGGIITNMSGIVNPSWHDWRNNFMLHCNWLVKVKPGRLIKLEFQRFNITNNNGECSTFVILRNGDSVESPLLGNGKYCGYSNEVREGLLSSSNSLFISYVDNNSARVFKSFLLWFEEKFDECGSRAILTTEHSWEVITSPNYPSIPVPYTECVWKFTGPPGEILRVDFDMVDLDKDVSCRTEHIEVRDGLSELSPLKLRFCGNEIPGSIKTSNNAIYIKYGTQKLTPNNGFKANISIDICGGTIVANVGELTSPGYPHMPVLKYGSICVWRVRGNPYFAFLFEAQDINLPNSETPCATKVTIEESSPEMNIMPILMTYCSEDFYGDSGKLVTTLTNDVTIKLHIGKLSAYSSFSVSRGFRFKFNSSVPKCGGVITTPEGYITTPNYPRDTTIRSCSWKITAPNENRRITLQFIDVDVQRHKISIYNDLSYRSLLQSIPSDDYYPTKKIFESTGNTLAIYLWLGTKSSSRHRFKAKFDSDKPSLCGERLSGLSGQFSSPILDRAYACKWTFNYNALDSTATNISTDAMFNTLHVKVYVNSSVNNIMCRYTDPKLNIKSIISSEAIKFNRDICGYSESEFRIPSPSVDFMAIKRNQGSLYFNVHWKLQQCGGVIRATENFVNILNIPYSYNVAIDCAWIILVPDNKRIELKLEGNFQLDCKKEFIKVNPDVSAYSTSIGDYCKDRMPDTSVLLKYSKIYIQYHTDRKNDTNIKIFIKTIENQCGGYLMTYESFFESPNYPKSYIENQECVWELKTDIGSRISLEFRGRFAIEFTPNCTKDTLIIYDWIYNSYKEVARLCGRNPPPPFNSTFNRMKVLWRTDNKINLDGFHARWSRICGGDYTATNLEQFLYSPGYPFEYGRNLNCIYTIHGLNEQSVILKFIEFELEESYPSCANDNLTIIGDPDDHYLSDSIYCGKEVPPLLTFKHIVLTLRTDSYMSKRGFKLSYKLTSCGGEIKNPGLIFLEPTIGQSFYEDDLNCTWHVEAPDNKIVVLRFEFFDLEGSSECTSDYLAIYDGSSVNDNDLLSVLCGNNNENSSFIIKSSQNNMFIFFHSDYGVGGRGFKIEVSFTYSSSVGCGGLINLTSTANYQLKSPLIGSKSEYENFLDCHWTIVAPKDYIIKLRFDTFHISPCKNVNQTEAGYNNCDCDYVDIKDGEDRNDPVINKYCGHTLPPDLMSSGNILTLILFTDGEINSSGFEVTFSAQTSICGHSTFYLGSTAITIKSPGYNTGSIPRGLHCAYNIILNNTQSPFIHVNIKKLDLEPADIDLNQCFKDKLIVSKFTKSRNIVKGQGYIKNWDNPTSFDYSYLYDLTVPQSSVTSTFVYCGHKTSIDLYFKGSFTLTLYTSPESVSVHKGFDIDIRESGFCGKNYTESYGRIQNSDKYYTENLHDCYTLITAQENYTISVHFLRVNPVLWDPDTFIAIHDGNTTNSTLLKKISSEDYNAMSIFSSGRNLLIHNHVVKNAYNFYDLTYVTTNKGPGCGGILHNVIGKITSPMYPNAYRRRTTCEWELETPSQTRLYLRFTEFDLGKYCDQVYLALVNRKGKTISRYCSETPADYRSDDNYVKVVFVTTLNNGGSGWVALFAAAT